MTEPVRLSSRVIVECFRPDGSLRWREDNGNMVVVGGKNDILNKYLTGASYTASWYAGLKGSGTISAADTMATHTGWSEVTGYSGSTRPIVAFGAASGGVTSNVAAPCTYVVTATAVVYGAFMASDSGKGGTAGTLYNASDFTLSRSVIAADTLTLTITPTVT